ncbi:hypothetical protein [Luedemannella helvata]|uniref:DUF5009 domain-containing protein n=1 Tax=Luedemannella helvata TaxID=349315 RepID=A0ABN2L456_9ACTN
MTGIVERPRRRGWSRPTAWWESALIVAGLVGHVFLVAHEARQDGWERYAALSRLLETGELPDTKYSMVMPIFAAPFWLLGKVVQDPRWWTERFNTIVLALGMLAIWLLLRRRVPGRQLRVFFLLLVAGSMFGNHLRFFYGEVFTAVLVAVGIVATVVGPRLVGWLTTVVGLVNTPASIAGLVTMVGERVLRTRALRYIAVIMVASAGVLVVNYLQRGRALDFGYVEDKGMRTIMPYSGLPNWSYPIFFGLFGLLFSAGKGLIWFAPGLFLPVRKGLRALGDDVRVIYRQWLAFLLGLLVVYAMWWSWQGGWFWGPRFVLFASIPASFAIALVWARREETGLGLNLFATLALILSIWVGINGAVYGDRALFKTCLGNYWYETPLCYHTPEFSVLWYPFVQSSPVAADQRIFFAYSLVVGAYLLIPMLATVVRQLAAHARNAGWLSRYDW